jgi:hypothetical protein
MSFTRLWKAVVVLDKALEEEMLHKFVELGASGYTTMECNGAGRKAVYQEPFAGHSQIRVEVVGSRATCEAIVRHVSKAEYRVHPVASYLEGVEVLQPERFIGQPPQTSP